MPVSLIEKLSGIPIACVDVETTGASAAFGHRVIEIGISRWENGKKVGEYSQLVDPRRRIDPGVSVMTGISQQMCDGQPTFGQQFDAMYQFLRGGIILGHNIRFDLSFLWREFRKCGKEIEQCLENAPVLDTVRIARRRFGRGGNSLGKLSRRMGYEPPVAHRALADADATAIVFDRMIEPVGGWGMCVCDAMVMQGGPMTLSLPAEKESLLPLELEEAMENRLPVMMEYLDASNNRTLRKIEPLRIRRRGGELILIAHCHLRRDQRTFKIERIVSLARIGEGEE